MSLKRKPKSFELDILSEAEAAALRTKDVEPREDSPRPPESTVMSKKWHAGVDMETLPAMTDEENELFDKLRQRGTYVVVIKKSKKYYLESMGGGVGPDSEPLKTRLVEDLIKKDWLHRSVKEGCVAFFATSHMVFGWRKRIGI